MIVLEVNKYRSLGTDLGSRTKFFDKALCVSSILESQKFHRVNEVNSGFIQYKRSQNFTSQKLLTVARNCTGYHKKVYKLNMKQLGESTTRSEF